MRQLSSLQELPSLLNQKIGLSEWFTISQERINNFAQATDDYQWIHVDEERAAKESPFKHTIAHGFLTLSLIPVLFKTLMTIEGISLAVNCGTNKVRFLTPVPSGGKIRLEATLSDVMTVKDGIKATFNCVVSLQENAKTVCIANLIVLYCE